MLCLRRAQRAMASVNAGLDAVRVCATLGCSQASAACFSVSLRREQRSFTTVHETKFINNEVIHAAQQKQTGISLQTLLSFGRAAENEPLDGAHPVRDKTVLTSSQFLHRELPIRLAHRMVELENLPAGLSDMPSIKQVLSWYRTSFDDIRAHPLPRDAASEASFTRLLASIYERHAPTVVTMAKGLVELRRSMKLGPRDPLPEGLATPLQQWLDIFFLARLGVRTLIAQHIAMHEPREEYVGIISPACSPYEVIASAAEDAREVCLRNYPDAPEITIRGDTALRFPYVPLMLRHVVFELLKNSLRATVERHKDAKELPPVEVVIASSDESEDIAIKVADRGGGISRTGMKRIFTYLYTTAASPVDLEDSTPAGDFSTRAPMAGLGFGLPLSRVFARYFGGDLHILSMQGYGTDAYIYLRRLGDASEPLSEASPTISGFARALARGRDSEEVFTTLAGKEDARGGAGYKGQSSDVWAGRGTHASFKVNIRSVEPTKGS